MAFNRRFTAIPTQAAETAIEGVNIIEQSSGGFVHEVQEGIAMVVGEFLKGPYNTPLSFTANSIEDLTAQLGGYSPYLGVGSYGTATTPPLSGGTNGNGFISFRGKLFNQTLACRVDLRLQNAAGIPSPAEPNAFAAVLTLTPSAAFGPPAGQLTPAPVILPAGFRFNAAAFANAPAGGITVMTDQDVLFPSGSAAAQTVNLVSVTGQFPGQPQLIASSPANVIPTVGVTWTAVDTYPSNFLTAAGVAVTLTPTNATVIMPAGAQAVAAAPIDYYLTAYTNAINACDTPLAPGGTADEIMSAFTSPDSAVTGTIVNQAVWTAGGTNAALNAHITSFRAHGKGRVAIINGQQGDTPNTGVAQSGGASGGALNAANKNMIHSNPLVYAYPWVQQFVPEAGATLTVPPAAWVGCAMSNVNPEANPGVPGLPALQGILALEGIINPAMTDYMNLKAGGIAAFYISQQTGVEIESGVTTDITGFMTIKNRRFQDFLEDTLAGFALSYIKLLQTTERQHTLVGKIHSYLSGLLSLEDPSLQRIAGFNLDPITGNTKARVGSGVFALKVTVQQLDDFRNIDLLMQVGENVTIVSQ